MGALCRLFAILFAGPSGTEVQVVWTDTKRDGTEIQKYMIFFVPLSAGVTAEELHELRAQNALLYLEGMKPSANAPNRAASSYVTGFTVIGTAAADTASVA